MAIVSGTKIVDDGLVFQYDMNNVRSFKGKPTTNLNAEDIPDLEQIGPPTLTQYSSPTPIGTTAYTVTDSSTSNYQLVRRGSVATIPNDTSTYYLSIYVKKNVSTAERFGINWGFDGGTTSISNNSRFDPQTGAASGSGTGGGSVVDLGEWWRWIVTSSNNATGNTNLYVNIYPAAGQNGSDDATATGTVVISALQIETGSFATPFVDGTRSNTEAIIDLTGNETVTANSLTYNSDNTFTFSNGEYITLANSASIFGSGSVSTTLDFWIKPISVSSHIPVGHQNVGGERLYIGIYPNVPQVWDLGWGGNAWNAGFTGTRPSVDFNQWQHICVSINSGVVSLYKNGVKSTFSKTDTTVNLTGVFPIGTYFENGGTPNAAYYGTDEIDIFRIYNRALSEAEVAQNFNASRTRFGI